MPQQVDYDALAQQHGGSAAAVDYDALAAQHGGNAASQPLAYPMDFIQRNYGHMGDSSPQQAVERFKNRDMLDKALDWGIFHVVDPFVAHTENAISAGGQGQIAKAGNEALKAATPFALAMGPEALAAKPLMTLAGVGTGVVGGGVTHAVAKAAGANPDQAEFAGNIGGILSGIGGAKLTQAGANLISSDEAQALAQRIKPLLTREITGRLPLGGRFDATRRPTLAEYLKAILEKPDVVSAEDTQVAGRTGDITPAPYRMSGSQIQDAATATPRRVLGPERQLPPYQEPAPAATPQPAISMPYRRASGQITDAVTVTPRQPFQPKALLPAAPEEAAPVTPAAPPKTAQVLKESGVTQAMKDAGIAAPSASSRAVRPGTTPQLQPRSDIQFPPGLSGQDAALMQLTRQNINELRFIAQKRGLPVTPKDTHADLIGKIHDSLTPAETDAFAQASQASQVVPSKFPENNLMADNLNEAAAHLQAQKGSPYEIASLRNAANTIRQYPQALSDVDLTQTKIRGIDKRIGKRINDFLQQQKAVPVDDLVQTTTGQPMTMMDAMRQSLMKRGIKPPQ